jgi:hypothetical protein
LKQELRSLIGILSIRKMRHEISTVQADWVTSGAESLNLIGRDLTNRLSLQWVTEKNRTSNLPSSESASSIVDSHGTLGVSTQQDLSLRALLESLSDELSHLRTAASAHLGVALLEC